MECFGQPLDNTIDKREVGGAHSALLTEEEKLSVQLGDMGLGRKKKLDSGSDISKEERVRPANQSSVLD